MILDELVLHDFGIYGGRQSITLTPEKNRPITLFGGLNGGGKTTLLDALQLCLYGPAARCSNRNGLAYDDFLRRSVHRGAPASEAAIELSFRHTAAGREHQFRVHRSWKAATSGCREFFHVLRDGVLDKMATEHWLEQVEEFIPARISHLFLFDGEKVESYAELGGAADLITTAVQNLLGLDIVERLVTDLSVLERRKRTEHKPADEATPSNGLRSRITALQDERAALIREKAVAANVLDRRRGELRAIEEKYRSEGGLLFERRVMLEAQRAAGERQVADIEKELRELCAGVAPFLMVGDLLRTAAQRAEAEESARHRHETEAAISKEYESILASPVIASWPERRRIELKGEFGRRAEERRSLGQVAITLNLPAEARGLLSSVLTIELDSVHTRLQELLRRGEQVAASLAHTQDQIAAIPSPDTIAVLASKRDAVQQELAGLTVEQTAREAEITRLEKEIAALKEQETQLAEAEAHRRFAHEDVNRMLFHAARVRTTLGRFRSAVVERHVARIERLVLDSFQQLVRKRSLVADLRIDPQSFALELRGPDGHVVTSDRLSAGERQLLAIALLWGLGRSSGRPLPTVIDTPLGRLDSVHRTHLVKRYFPQASHQVLLLSTDEEIAGSYYEALRPAISRSYHLRFDEGEGRTVVESGYFGQGNGHAP